MMHERIIVVNPSPDNAGVNKPYSTTPADPRVIIETQRVKLGIKSARALATMAGVPQPTLSRYLAGTSDVMDVRNFQAIARVLGLTLSELLGEVPLHDDPNVRSVLLAMERIPESQRGALVAAAVAMADHADHRPADSSPPKP